MNRIQSTLGATLVATLTAAASAGSTVLFDNYFGPDNGTANGGPFFGYAPGFFGGPAHLAPVTQIANSFEVLGGDFYLESVHATMMTVPESISGNAINDGVTMRIHASDGAVPGAVLGAFSVIAPLVNIPGGQGPVATETPTLFDFSGSGILLQSGHTYWLSVEANNNGFAVWGAAFTPDSDPKDPLIPETAPGTYSVKVNSGDWQTGYVNDQAAFRVNGTVVPAPGAALLFACSAPFITRRRR